MYYIIILIFILITALIILSVTKALKTFGKMVEEDEISSNSGNNNEN